MGEPLAIALEHGDVREQVMPEGHRLRHLQVREARHHQCGVALGLADQRAHQADEQLVGGVDFFTQPEPQIGRDLVVARARGVQALAGLADKRGQPPFDVEVHILGVERPGELALVDLAPDPREAALDRRKIRFLDDAGRCQHACMGEGGGNIVPGKPPIEINRGAEALYALVDRLPEAARPRLRLARHARTMSLNTV